MKLLSVTMLMKTTVNKQYLPNVVLLVFKDEKVLYFSWDDLIRRELLAIQV